MKKKLEEMSSGVYLMPGYRDVVVTPKEAMGRIHGQLGSIMMEKAMLLFISFSVKHSAWCIVTWPRLMEEIRKGYSIPIEIRAMKTMFGMLVQDGYLSLPRPDGWFERLFGQEMVYPTKALFDVVSRAMAKSDAD